VVLGEETVPALRENQMIEAAGYVNVNERMAELGLTSPAGVVLLPRGFADVSGSHELLDESDALDLVKLLKSEGVDAALVTRKGEKLPTIAEHDILAHLPDLLLQGVTVGMIPITLGVIGNYVYDKLIGTFVKPDVRLNVIVKRQDGEYTRVSYQGPVDGLKVLEKTIQEAVRDDH